MSELLITFDKESPSVIDEKINIKVISEEDNSVEYKFLEGAPGERNLTWKPIQDFSNKKECEWRPRKSGDYMIMVQYKEKDSKELKNTKINYQIKGIEEKEILESNKKNNKLIKDVIIDKTSLIIGEKINLEVLSSEEEILLYRFWIKGKQGWEPLKDYSTENKLTYTTTKSGDGELLIECKRPSSKENVDDFTTVIFKVKEQPLIEVNAFECLTENLLINEELIFKVGVNCDKSRTILYKFLRVDTNGRITCIQDYSTKNIVSFYEKQKGDFKLLCYVRDIFSNKQYDDRACMMYTIKPYDEIKIRNFSSDLNSPQVAGTNITFKSSVIGGKEILYRYIVEGPVAEDTGYIRSRSFNWEAKLDGEYKIILKAKDISFDGEYEDIKELNFKIDKKGEKPVNILDIFSSKTRGCIKCEPINIKVKAEGGTSLKYSFIVYKDGKEKERSNYGITNWVNFTPEESGEYQVEVRVLDKYSSKEYDVHDFVYFKVKDYQEAEIDYVLLSQKEIYLVGDLIELETIVQNTKNILLRYVTKINGHEVEDTGFIESKRLRVKPKCSGKYTFEIYAKNTLCNEDYDIKKEVSLYVHEATPVSNTKVKIKNKNIVVNNEVTFEVTSEGGKEVCYEFYIMEKGNWVRVQSYSRKNYYTFVPFSTGSYRILVLSKSYYKKVNYEDYISLEFEVEP
ncbi:triple tyrosine motif-containing protein [Clostridium tertium]|jgi:Y_Y_Y domain|uniref:triple tyrosine motif-containing protein n=1 Tax=Clostridium TaxID=1485 RepID=UPI00115A64FA|nr:MULTISPECIES: triple tyrosine motif-containing protein [Clostridium]MBS5305912.1 triple tyrosine motif-containing protein [Clostridium sp.]MDB1920980.1 triple tyrosine motif-containing protein [Clostridium tertium]MDB1925510.1 triple tyrosine motif-containing protein [Clostridium tertium]MDB1928593.1 triple tyrosine motif-containing protein [Clostridium tertium]MDB1943612.1 triple tyrosine motif-containing protein [Clostridium tertium]